MSGSKNLKSQNGIPPLMQSRRSFIKTLVVAGSSITIGVITPPKLWTQTRGKKPRFSMILVDFNRCTGCRTCETVCAQFNFQKKIAGEKVWGLGNPHLANIRVYPFNPDVDVPVVCVMCKDNPCVKACPVEADKQGRKALYRDPKTLAVTCNHERCIACGSCAEACSTQRVGAIIPNTETNHPERLCTLCQGDPQCVKYCPYGAITHLQGGLGGEHYGMSASQIAEELIKRWYGSSRIEGGEIK